MATVNPKCPWCLRRHRKFPKRCYLEAMDDTVQAQLVAFISSATLRLYGEAEATGTEQKRWASSNLRVLRQRVKAYISANFPEQSQP